MKPLTAFLGIGPLSTEIIEVTFQFSHQTHQQVMLIASKNQIDYAGGYVNNWLTQEYVNHVRSLKETYTHADVLICRDHCGPGFNGKDDLDDVYQTIDTDLACGFDLIHVDCCHHDKPLDGVIECIERIKRTGKKVWIEVGTEENNGQPSKTAGDIKFELDILRRYVQAPDIYVFQTGSLVKDFWQHGTFDKTFVSTVLPSLRSFDIRLKEHNADYLQTHEIQQRQGMVDMMNIAPQLGVLQTSIILNNCLKYGISLNELCQFVLSGEKFKRWIADISPADKWGCFMVSGHYFFSSEPFLEVTDRLSQYCPWQRIVREAVYEVIKHYHDARAV